MCLWWSKLFSFKSDHSLSMNPMVEEKLWSIACVYVAHCLANRAVDQVVKINAKANFKQSKLARNITQYFGYLNRTGKNPLLNSRDRQVPSGRDDVPDLNLPSWTQPRRIKFPSPHTPQIIAVNGVIAHKLQSHYCSMELQPCS